MLIRSMDAADVVGLLVKALKESKDDLAPAVADLLGQAEGEGERRQAFTVPCPRCGAQPERVRHKGQQLALACPKCGYIVGGYDEALVAEMWNRLSGVNVSWADAPAGTEK